MWKVAPEFGLSGNGLAKLCRREGIPVPERGYWAKLARGKRVKRPPLKPSPGNSETLTIEATPPNRSTLELSMPELLAALLRAEREASEPIAVPNSPKLHGLVEAWPKPQKPSYGLPWFTTEGESRRRRIASVLFREIERRGGSVSANKLATYTRSTSIRGATSGRRSCCPHCRRFPFPKHAKEQASAGRKCSATVTRARGRIRSTSKPLNDC